MMAEDNIPSQTADRIAIMDLLYRYARSVDRIDKPLGHSVWHPHGVADYGDFFRGNGRDSIDLICDSHLHLAMTQHLVSNIVIDLNGDEAGSESCVFASLRREGPDGPVQLSVWGRYLDKWARIDGQWGLVSRVSIMDMQDARPATPFGSAGGTSRDHSDPSYAVLGGYPAGAGALAV
mgnify:CR=1 FL=1